MRRRLLNSNGEGPLINCYPPPHSRIYTQHNTRLASSKERREGHSFMPIPPPPPRPPRGVPSLPSFFPICV